MENIEEKLRFEEKRVIDIVEKTHKRDAIIYSDAKKVPEPECRPSEYLAASNYIESLKIGHGGRS